MLVVECIVRDFGFDPLFLVVLEAQMDEVEELFPQHFEAVLCDFMLTVFELIDYIFDRLDVDMFEVVYLFSVEGEQSVFVDTITLRKALESI